MRLSVLAPTEEVAPASAVTLVVTIVNDGSEPAHPTLSLSGLGGLRLVHADAPPELHPGAECQVTITLEVAEEATPGPQRIGVTVRDANGLQEPAWGTDIVRVGSRPDIGVELNPGAIAGRRRARFDAVLQHRGLSPVTVHLEGEAEHADVEFRTDEIRIRPGETVTVPGSVERHRPTWFRSVRHGLLVGVRGSGAPVTVAGTYTQKPVFAPWFLKVVAIITVLAVWAAAVLVIVDRYEQRRGEPPIAADATPEPEPDGSDTPAPDPTGPDGEAPVDGEPPAGEDAPEVAPPVVVEGAVTGPRDPAGTAVVIERISFGDQGTTSGAGDTKVAALTSRAPTTGTVIGRWDTTTDERGRFRFSSGLSPRAFYRVTAQRAGFDTASAVVRTIEEEAAEEVNLQMVSASASMSGTAVDSETGRGVGGAEVTVVTEGLTYRTVTSTTPGSEGRWELAGLASPAAYQVSVRERRYATATIIRTLEGGEVAGGVELSLQRGLGTVTGVVVNRAAGVGGITATIVGEGVQRTTTTLTADDQVAPSPSPSPALAPAAAGRQAARATRSVETVSLEGIEGTFAFEALPFGTYQLTLSGPGWQSQTAEVVVDRGDVTADLRDLVSDTAVIHGRIVQEVLPDSCTYPEPTERADVVARACGGVGITARSPEGTYSTTSATQDGRFELRGLPPGQYSVAIERFGYKAVFRAAELVAGDEVELTGDPDPAAEEGSELPPILMRLIDPVATDVGVIKGVLTSVLDPSSGLVLPTDTAISVVGFDAAVVSDAGFADGVFTVGGLPPGAHSLRFDVPGYDVRRMLVRVGLTDPVDLGAVPLTPLATLALRVTDGAELPVGGAVVYVEPTSAAGRLHLAPVTPPLVDPFGVRWCSVETVDGRLVEDVDATGPPTGLCATVDVNGDVSFPQAVGTGPYRIVTPVNVSDIDDDAAGLTGEALQAHLRARALTVPLDHAPLQRQVEVQSGETTRLDLRIRRYAIVEGRIRARDGDAGFVNAPFDTFIDPDTGRDGLATFPDVSGDPPLGISLELLEESIDPAQPPQTVSLLDRLPAHLLPRVSFGRSAGLQEGVFRINRVLPNELGNTRDYILSFYDRDGLQFSYPPESALSGLAFGETRTANALMLPAPVGTRLRFQRTVISEPEPRPFDVAPDVTGTVRGVTEVQVELGGIFPILRTLDLAAVPRDALAGDDLLLLTDSAGIPVKFIGSYGLDTSVSHPWVEPYSRTVTFDADDAVDGTVDVPVLLTPLPRTVTGRLAIVPTVGVDDLWRDLELSLELKGGVDVDPLLPVTLDREPGSPTLGAFRFEDVPPELYDLVVTGPGLFSDRFPVDVLPGPAADPFALVPAAPDASAPDAFPVAAKVDLDLVVEADIVRPPNTTPVAERLELTTDDVVIGIDGIDDRTVRLLVDDALDGVGFIDVADHPLLAGDLRVPVVTQGGGVTFGTLRGGDRWTYRVVVARTGYRPTCAPGAPAPPRCTAPTDFNLGNLTPAVGPTEAQVVADQTVKVNRFGSIEATILSRLDADETVPLGGAEVELFLDGIKRGASVFTPSGNPGNPSNGLALFPFTRELDASANLAADAPPGQYDLRVSATDHDPPAAPTQITVADDTVTSAQITLDVTKATIGGTVTNAPTGLGLPHVRVTVLKGNLNSIGPNSRVYGATWTDANGVWDIADIPPGTLTLRFEEFESDDDAASNATSRMTVEIEVQQQRPSQGGELVGACVDAVTGRCDIALLEQLVAVSGTVEGIDFAGATTRTELDGATVTITCTSGDCFDGAGAPTQRSGVTPFINERPDGSVTTTAGVPGVFAFNILPVGTYAVSVARSNYTSPVDETVEVIRFDATSTPQPHVLTSTMVATPKPVPVRVDLGTYDASGAVTARTPAPDSVVVRASYTGPEASGPTIGDATLTTGTTSLSLPPGTWTLETVGADTYDPAGPRPHGDEVRAGALAFAADDAAPSQVDFTLRPYLRVSGSTRVRDYVGATYATDSTVGVALTGPGGQPGYFEMLTVGPSDGSGSTGVDGGWAVLVPPATSGYAGDWTLALSRVHHYGADLVIGDAARAFVDTTVAGTSAPAGITLGATDPAAPAPLAPAYITEGVALTAVPVPVTVAVRSGQDSSALNGVTVAGVLAGGGPASLDAAPYRTSAATAGGAAANLVLAPGTWTFTTTGASTPADPSVQPPHFEETSGQPGGGLAVASGATPSTTVTLGRYGFIAGTVVSVAAVDETDPAPEPLAGVTLTATPASVVPNGVSDASGNWKVWIADGTVATSITFTADGHTAEPDASPLVIPASTVTPPGEHTVTDAVQMVANPVPVTVTLRSSVGNTPLVGIEVLATGTGKNSALSERVRTDASGVATFPPLATGNWDFSTTDAPTATRVCDVGETGNCFQPPHKNLAVTKKKVPRAGSADFPFTLTRYASYAGTAGVARFDGDDITPDATVLVEATGASASVAVAEPPLGSNDAVAWGSSAVANAQGVDGFWRFWFPDPRVLNLAFTKQYYQRTTLGLGASTSRDAVRADLVGLIADPRRVTVKIVSDDGGEALRGVTVQATAANVPGSPFSATAATVGDGVATFAALPPVTWTFTVSGAPGATIDGQLGKAPHRNSVVAPATRVVPVGDAATTVDHTGAPLALLPYAAITGTVKIRDNANAPAVATNDVTMSVVQPGTTTAFAGALTDAPGYSGVTGAFRAWVVPDSVVDVRFTKDGYTEGRANADTDDAASPPYGNVAVGDVVLTGSARPVEVLVVSNASGNPPLRGVRVRATSVAAASDVTSVASNSSGIASFAGLVPASDWQFSTIDGPSASIGTDVAVTPHQDIAVASAVTRRVPPGSSTYRFDSSTGTTVDDRLQLARYAAITGTVRAPTYPGQPTPAAADPTGLDVFAPNTTTAFSAAQTPDAIGYAGTGTWRVWVPVGSLVDVRLQLTDYDDRTLEDIDTTSGDQPQGDVAMIPSARPVTLLVVSDNDPDAADPLGGVTVEATSVAAGVGAAADVQATTGADGRATFAGLTPSNDWVFTTLDAAVATIDPATVATPHEDDATTSRTVDVGSGPVILADGGSTPATAGTTDDRLVLARYAAITGRVLAPSYLGEPTPAAADPTGLDVFAPNTTTAFSAAQTPDAIGYAGTGTWRVWVPVGSLVDVRLQLTDYDDETLQDVDTTSGDQPQGDVTMTPAARAVDLLVVSSVGDAPLADVTVEATSVTAGVSASNDVQATTNAAGVASFSGLVPADDWVFTTLDAVDARVDPDTLATPHEDGATSARLVVAGSGTLSLADDGTTTAGDTTDDRLVLTRYDVVTGTLKTQFHAPPDNELPADADADSITAYDAGTTDVSSVAVVQAPYAGVGTWRVWVPATGDHDADVVFVKTGYGDETEEIRGSVGDGDTAVLMTAIPRVVRIRFVKGGTGTDAGDPISGATVRATEPLPGTGFIEADTDVDGYALFEDPAGPTDDRLYPDPDAWTFTTAGAPANFYDVGEDATLSPAVGRVIPVWDGTGTVSDPYVPADLVAPANSRLYGRVGEYRGGVFAPLAGIEVVAERDAERASATSTELDPGGYNYNLRAKSGTWRITAVRDGVTTLVDDAFVIHKDEEGAPRNWLDIVLPRDGGSTIAGVVVDDGGVGVAGASVSATSSVGSAAVTTAQDGSYRLAGLDPEVTWRVTFTPPAGAPGVAVSRYVAPGGGTGSITLHQSIPSGLGHIEVQVTNGPPAAGVTVTLRELTPFPTVNADGTLVRPTSFGADGSAAVTFADLVPGGGVSVPNDRFDIRVEVDGYEPITRNGVDVHSGATTVVTIELPTPPVPTTILDLTLTSGGEPLADRAVRINQDRIYLPSTVTPGDHTYRFHDVTPGDWLVLVDGFEEATISVAAAAPTEAIEVDLVPIVPPAPHPTAPASTGSTEPADAPLTDPTSEPSTAESPAPAPAPAPSASRSPAAEPGPSPSAAEPPADGEPSLSPSPSADGG